MILAPRKTPRPNDPDFDVVADSEVIGRLVHRYPDDGREPYWLLVGPKGDLLMADHEAENERLRSLVSSVVTVLSTTYGSKDSFAYTVNIEAAVDDLGGL